MAASSREATLTPRRRGEAGSISIQIIYVHVKFYSKTKIDMNWIEHMEFVDSLTTQHEISGPIV